MKVKKELTELREKTIDELKALARELRESIESERVQSYFKDQTSTNNVQSSRKKLARVLTIITEKEKEEKKEAKQK